MRISLIIPCVNEQGNVTILADKIRKAFEGKFDYEVIWVDDGSIDKTPDELKEISRSYPEQKALILMRNVGQSNALMAGIDIAKGEYIATMDGDNQNDPDEIPTMLQKLEKEDLDVVVGWRKKRWKGNPVRRIPSIVANKIIKNSFRMIEVHDAGCPVKVIKADLMKHITLYGELHRFLTYILGDMGARVGEIEIKHRKRTIGKSNYGLGRIPKVLIDILNLKFVTMRKKTPAQVIGPFAVYMMLIGLVSGIMMIYQKFAYGQDMTDSPLLILSVLSIVMGVQVFILGLLGEFIIRSYFEGSGKKKYYVREVVEFNE